MNDNYFVINIQQYLSKDKSTYIGEEALYDLISDFSCPKNPNVEKFLLNNAIEFTKKNQSVTYLVFNNNDDASLVGYFSIAIKLISIRSTNISKTSAKRISRMGIFDKATQSYLTPAYLIAQIGKNYSISKEKQISGDFLLNCALDKIVFLQYNVGGILEFLECEDNLFLLNFYKQNHFKQFDKRVTSSNNTESHTLHQLMKFIS